MIYVAIQKRCYSALSVKDLVLVAEELPPSMRSWYMPTFYDLTNSDGEIQSAIKLVITKFIKLGTSRNKR